MSDACWILKTAKEKVKKAGGEIIIPEIKKPEVKPKDTQKEGTKDAKVEGKKEVEKAPTEA